MRADEVVQWPWTAAEDEVLRDLWVRPDSSATKIGRVLGRSRNSVVGRAQRICRDLKCGREQPQSFVAARARAAASKDAAAAIRKLAPTGIGTREIARKLDLSYGTARRIIKDHAIRVVPGKTGWVQYSSLPAAERVRRREVAVKQAKKVAAVIKDDAALRIGPLPLPPGQDLKHGCCPYPSGSGVDWFYCLEPSASPRGLPWCAKHFAVCYRTDATEEAA